MGVEVNQRIGDYDVLSELGKGGMGKVYKVRNVISNRVEAMKVLLPDLAGREDLAVRFQREIQLLASLHHTNIASLCTALKVDNQLLMIMEFVEGVTLAELLGLKQIAVQDAIDYTSQALSALSYAHQRGIIHRDMKPANVMLTNDGTIKLMDFGVAHSAAGQGLTQIGTILGSYQYMSPEQITGRPPDARSDIYSTGVSLYEIVTGQRPFRATTNDDLMAMHMKEAPKPPIELQPTLPMRLNKAILTAIAKDPTDRFQSADEFRNALREAEGSVETAPLPLVHNPSPFRANLSDSSAVSAKPGDGAQLVSQSPGSLSQAALARRSSTGSRIAYVAVGAVVALTAAGVPAYLVFSHHSGVPAPVAPPPVVAPPNTNQSKIVAVRPPTDRAQSDPPPSPGAQRQINPPPPATRSPENVSAPSTAGGQSSATISTELKAQLDTLEARVDEDTSKVAAINSSLNNMQAQMQRDGMALRMDVVTQQSSMNLNLAKAQKALESHDADRGERFASLAEADIAQLLKFLGR